MTNFERIKAMTVEDMANFIGAIVYEMENCIKCPAYNLPDEVCCENCEDGIKVWLEIEVKVID